ncbi:selenide, water dikinase SelD [Wohlfahrtiimonas larvae]|uniref:Selenide, water dikinase n=1 Tax=Wohlfahrtiimonas larvae TaxID=1157986 RepID=A0ABP9MQ68_9GAMM
MGNQSRDDAAVYGIDEKTGIISTTDFFMPIVDDPFDFGRIAATNSISDIYAMGGKPIMAIAILGWPTNVLAPEIARTVIEGGRAICDEAGIVLAGGHSIDAPEPIFGLSVTGIVDKSHLKRNDTAQVGDYLFLTKPLGIGILTTAEKRGLLKDEDKHSARDVMIQLNKVGAEFAKYDYIHAMTDITGFGLIGHLSEMTEGSNISVELFSDAIPLIENVRHYESLGSMPGGTFRNLDNYGYLVEKNNAFEQYKHILGDPQTSGGLLVSVSPNHIEEFLSLSYELGLKDLNPIGQMISSKEYRIYPKSSLM